VTDYVFGGRREADAPHTTEGRNAEEVARLASLRLGIPAGWWGMLMVIASEFTILAAMIGTYWYLRLRAPHWPPPGIPEPRVVVPMVLAGVLLLTSVPLRLAARAVRAGRLVATRLLILLALVVQAGYFSYEVVDYGDQIRKANITRDAYTSIYYTLLGADHAHVFVGMLLSVWLLLKLARGLTMYRLNATVAITWYWHFVNVLTVVIIGTLTSVHVA
jgi:heme/copper-type cytochrome/quinol oxidase subunit 3